MVAAVIPVTGMGPDWCVTHQRHTHATCQVLRNPPANSDKHLDLQLFFLTHEDGNTLYDVSDLNATV